MIVILSAGGIVSRKKAKPPQPSREMVLSQTMHKTLRRKDAIISARRTK
jgi:hypothetical protein